MVKDLSMQVEQVVIDDSPINGIAIYNIINSETGESVGTDWAFPEEPNVS